MVTAYRCEAKVAELERQTTSLLETSLVRIPGVRVIGDTMLGNAAELKALLAALGEGGGSTERKRLAALTGADSLLMAEVRLRPAPPKTAEEHIPAYSHEQNCIRGVLFLSVLGIPSTLLMRPETTDDAFVVFHDVSVCCTLKLHDLGSGNILWLGTHTLSGLNLLEEELSFDSESLFNRTSPELRKLPTIDAVAEKAIQDCCASLAEEWSRNLQKSVLAARANVVPAAGPGRGKHSDRKPHAIADRWAVLIGISDYKHKTGRLRDLEYAHRDAEQFAAFFQSRKGGSFPADHVRLLTNEKATVTNIRDALFEFLKHTVTEDLVVIFFAGHGLPDPDKPSNLYLMAHDSDPARVAATGIPMWDVEAALTRTIAAERVVVLADACHSAGVTDGVRGVSPRPRFNSYFEELARTKPGRVVFTSCEGYEVSRESEKWGGGHGVFTWALLEGLKGKADKDEDGFVRLGEILDYVDITVRRETANEQHPARAGAQFDRNLPMGVVK